MAKSAKSVEKWQKVWKKCDHAILDTLRCDQFDFFFIDEDAFYIGGDIDLTLTCFTLCLISGK